MNSHPYYPHHPDTLARAAGDQSALVDEVLERFDSSPLRDAAQLLVLAALDSDEQLERMLDIDHDDATAHEGLAGYRRAHIQQRAPDAAATGVFLKSVTVSGFRGIGPRQTLPLSPYPGLTIITGRNGSGKSSFAEALEFALTGTSYRWQGRAATWRDGWRNLHDGSVPAITVEFAEAGASTPTQLGVSWPAATKPHGVRIDDASRWAQRAGSRRMSVEELGWQRALEQRRPLLSYEELGTLLTGEPSVLHDALHQLLGLDRLVAAQRRLRAVVTQLSEHKKAATALARELGSALPTLADHDERAALALRVITAKRPSTADVAALRGALSTAPDSNGEVAVLRRLAAVAAPQADAVTAVVAELRAAATDHDATRQVMLDAMDRRAELLRQAVELHDAEGDIACPICGVGTLDATWRARAIADLGQQHRERDAERQAHKRLRAACDAARQLLGTVRLPEMTRLDAETMALLSDTALGENLAAARESLAAWYEAPDTPVELASHLEARYETLATALSRLAARAATLIAAREDAWAPFAERASAWLEAHAQETARAARRCDADAAAKWLKDNVIALSNDRLEPLTTRACEIWRRMRQQSNVSIGSITLTGTGSRRRVAFTSSIDGAETDTLAVLSQGELHALALALFLPRATSPESPFRFVVLDDPIQAMDPAKIEGFVDVLASFARDRQVIVFSHDDRLANAVRRRSLRNAKILHVDRAAGSRVTVETADDPAARHLQNARAVLVGKLAEDLKQRTVPTLLRYALEAAAFDLFMSNHHTAGGLTYDAEERWQQEHTATSRIALALAKDPLGKTPDITRWLKHGNRKRVIGLCDRASHGKPIRELGTLADDVARIITELRASVTGGTR